MSIAAVVLGAGRGERLGYALPKAFVPVLGQTLLERSLAALAAHPEVDLVVPVIPSDAFERYADLALGERLSKLAEPVAGGVERQDSVERGLSALPAGTEWVLVHDAARCLVTAGEISAVIAAVRESDAALLALPARDTIKRVVDGVVQETPPRAECWAAQTPQAFRVSLLRKALAAAQAAGLLGTDDSQLVERLGVKVKVVPGLSSNLKITVPEDIAVAEAWLRASGAGAGRGESQQ